MYVDGISKVQCSLDPVAWTKSVKADKSVSVTDDISYLFRSDTMRFKKTVLLKTLKQSGKRNGKNFLHRILFINLLLMMELKVKINF